MQNTHIVLSYPTNHGQSGFEELHDLLVLLFQITATEN